MPAANANAARITRKAEAAQPELSASRAGSPGPQRVNLPARSPTVIKAFARYARWYVSRHFHGVRISNAGLPVVPPDRPLVLFVNHASWWDPLVCLLLDQTYFPGRAAWAPIDATALKQYRFFARLGFFGVEQGTRRGAVTFLRTAEAILASANSTLWLTPQGRFADVRERPVRFAAGLGHLASRAHHACFVPVALEYPFWEESRPEVLVRFGAMVPLPPDLAPDAGSMRLETALAATQDALAAESLRRRPADFTVLLAGGAGVGGIYDLWRRLRAWAGGRRFRAEHGTK